MPHGDSEKHDRRSSWREYKARKELESPGFGRDKKLRQRYGLSLDDWQALVDMQDGCAICHTRDGKLHVDHCHRTGIVRGILCENCNRGLGMFADDKSRLKAAMEYLDASEARFLQGMSLIPGR